MTNDEEAAVEALAYRDGTSLAARRASFVCSSASLSLRRQALNRDFHEPASLREATSAQRSSSQRAAASSARARSRSARADACSYSDRQSRGWRTGSADAAGLNGSVGGQTAEQEGGVREVTLRIVGVSILVVLTLALPTATGVAGEVRIAAWNLEHLNATGSEGCLPRTAADYRAIARQVTELDADVVAFQEVENEAAAWRVFPDSYWNVEMSSRLPMARPRKCRDRPEARLRHLATGFAIRRGIAYRRNDDLKALGGGDAIQRWGTDITVTADGGQLRLLSVHLRSGCWGAKQDRDTKRATTCAVLRAQMRHLKAWSDARRVEGTAFVILGDFNRRLTLPDDWAWRLLAPPSAPLRLVTGGAARCDPRFPAFIDHLVAGGGAETMLVPGSFHEVARSGPHPDHCAVTADFRVGR